MKIKNNAKFAGELTCHFKTVMKNLMNFDLTTLNLKNLLFNWFLWPKYIIFQLQQVQKSHVWWHWRLIQNFRENWFPLSKRTWGIWQVCIGWMKYMNNTFNKTFYTCLTVSLFLDLRYMQISKKAVQLGSFLQCSVHIFLGYDGCFKN